MKTHCIASVQVRTGVNKRLQQLHVTYPPPHTVLIPRIHGVDMDAPVTAAKKMGVAPSAPRTQSGEVPESSREMTFATSL